MRKQKKLTPEQVQKIVAEVGEWNGELAEIFVVRWVTHLWEISGEYYLVLYENYQTDVFHREKKDEKLMAVRRTTYFGPHWTDVPRSLKSKQQEEEEKEQQ